VDLLLELDVRMNLGRHGNFLSEVQDEHSVFTTSRYRWPSRCRYGAGAGSFIATHGVISTPSFRVEFGRRLRLETVQRTRGAGHGPMVILLHRYAETLRMWRPIIPLLEKFSVIVPDLPALRHNNAFDPGLSFRARAFA